MTAPNQSSSEKSTSTYEEKVQKIADRVWQLWQQELRDERERRGKDRK